MIFHGLECILVRISKPAATSIALSLIALKPPGNIKNMIGITLISHIFMIITLLFLTAALYFSGQSPLLAGRWGQCPEDGGGRWGQCPEDTVPILLD